MLIAQQCMQQGQPVQQHLQPPHAGASSEASDRCTSSGRHIATEKRRRDRINEG